MNSQILIVLESSQLEAKIKDTWKSKVENQVYINLSKKTDYQL